MSDNIEKRSLELEFKHAQFEAAVSKTLASLDKLNKSLNMQEAKRGLEEFKKESNRFELSGISNALDKVEKRFESFGYRLKVNVFDKIIRYSENLGKSIMITPISTGYSEYGLLLDSIRVIKSSTGETVETIQGYLDELNEYSDKTIYSFSDMTRNIGKFTNAGVKLDVATKAIQGISNAAALAGVSAAQAEHAMYNLAQALPAGYVRYRDWWSVVNANMATVEFKQQLIDTAEELGTLTKIGDNLWKTTKQEINATKNFDMSLNDAWLTTEVLTTTLEKYADETTEIGKKAFEAAGEVTTFNKMLTVLRETSQSGWALSWRYVVGDYEEAKVLLTDLTKIFSDIINRQADSRNLALKEWKALGGREKLLKSIHYILSGIQAIIRSISIGWENVFGKIGGKQLYTWTEMLEKGSKKLRDFFIVENVDENGNVITEWTQNGLKLINISEGIASVFGILINLMKQMGLASIIFFKPLLKNFLPNWMFSLIPILQLTGLLKPFLGMLYDLTTITGMFFQNLYTNLKENKTFQSAFSKFKDAWEPIRSEIEKAMNSFVLFFASLLLGDDSLKGTSGLLESFLKIMTPIGKILGTAFGYAKKFFGYFFKEVKNSDLIKSFGGSLTSTIGSVSGFFEQIYKSFTTNPLTDEQIEESAKKTWEDISKFLTQVASIFEYVFTVITEFVKAFAEFGKSSGLFDLIGGIFKSFISFIETTFKSINDYIKENPIDIEKIKETAKQVVGALVSFLTNPLENISKIWKEIKQFISGIISLFYGPQLEKEIDDQSGKAKKNVAKKNVGIGDLLMSLFIPSASAEEISTPSDLAVFPETALEEMDAWKELQAARRDIAESSKNDPKYIESFIGEIAKVNEKISESFSKELENNGGLILTIVAYVKRLSKVLFWGFMGYQFVRIVKGFKDLVTSISSIASSIAAFKHGWYKVELNKSKALKFIASALLIATMATAIYKLAQVENPMKLINAVAVITAFYTIYSILTSLTSTTKINKSETGKGFYNIAGSILMLIVTLGIIAGAIYFLNDVSWEEYRRGTENLKYFFVTFGVILAITSLLLSLLQRASGLKKDKFSGMEFLWIGVSLAAFVGLFIFLSKYKFSQFTEAFWIVGSITVGLVLLMALLAVIEKYAGPIPKKGVLGLISIAIAIKMLIGPIMTLQLLGKNVWRPVVSVVALILSLGAALAAMSKIRNPILGSIGIIAIMASIYILLNQITSMVTRGVNIKDVSDLVIAIAIALGGLGVALAGLGAAAAGLSGAGKVLGSGGIKGLLLGLVGELGTAFVGAIFLNVILSFVNTIAGIVYDITGKLKDMSDDLAGVNLDNLGKLKDAITKISDAVYQMPSLDQLKKVKKFSDAMSDLGGAFNASAYGFSQIDLIDILKATTSICLMSGAMQSLEKINPDFDYQKAAAAFVALGSALDLYNQFTTDINETVESIGDVGSIPDQNKKKYNIEELNRFLQDIITVAPDKELMGTLSEYGVEDQGGASLTSWAVGINAIAKAVASIGIGDEEIDFNRIENVINALQRLKEINEGLVGVGIAVKHTKESGLIKANEAFSTESWALQIDTAGFDSALGQFATDIGELASAFNGFGKALSDTLIDYDLVERGFGTLERLGTLYTDLIRETGEFSVAFGNNSWAQGTNMLKINLTGLVTWLQGNTLTNFANGLQSLGHGFHDYAEALSLFEDPKTHDRLDASTILGNAERGTGVIGTIAKIRESLSPSGGMSQWITGIKDLSGFGKGIKDLGDGFSSFATALSIFKDPKTGELLKASDVLGNAKEGTGIIGSLADLNNKLGPTGGLLQFITGSKNLTDFANGIRDLSREMSFMLDDVNNKDWENWNSYGKPFFEFLSGIASDTDGWASRFTTLSKSMELLGLGMDHYLQSTITLFPDTPETDDAITHMGKITKKYFDALNDAFVGEEGGSDNITQFTTAVSQLHDLLTAEIETQPVITPVLDLTQITSDVDNLNNLITPNRMFKIRSINSNTQASDLQSRMFTSNGNIIINDDHSDVVSAVNKLGPKIDRLNTSLSGLKIVMNTGVLAGELTGPINKNLGKMASRGQGGS